MSNLVQPIVSKVLYPTHITPLQTGSILVQLMFRICLELQLVTCNNNYLFSLTEGELPIGEPFIVDKLINKLAMLILYFWTFCQRYTKTQWQQ